MDSKSGKQPHKEEKNEEKEGNSGKGKKGKSQKNKLYRLDSNTKWALTISILIAALIIIWAVFTNNTSSLNDYAGKTISAAQMKQEMLDRPLCVAFENPANESLRQSVMNCGLEYYRTALLSLPTKDVEFFGIDGNKCMASIPLCKTFPCSQTKDVTWSLGNCINYWAKKNCYVLLVENGNPKNSNSFENMLKVYVNNTYKEGECSLSASTASVSKG